MPCGFLVSTYNDSTAKRVAFTFPSITSSTEAKVYMLRYVLKLNDIHATTGCHFCYSFDIILYSRTRSRPIPVVKKSLKLVKARTSMACCVSLVSVPMCGNSVTFGNSSKRGWTSGSFGKTSRPAPPSCSGLCQSIAVSRKKKHLHAHPPRLASAPPHQ